MAPATACSVVVNAPRPERSPRARRASPRISRSTRRRSSSAARRASACDSGSATTALEAAQLGQPGSHRLVVGRAHQRGVPHHRAHRLDPVQQLAWPAVGDGEAGADLDQLGAVLGGVRPRLQRAEPGLRRGGDPQPGGHRPPRRGPVRPCCSARRATTWPSRMRSVARPRDACGPASGEERAGLLLAPGAGVQQGGEQHRRQGLGAPAAGRQGLGRSRPARRRRRRRPASAGPAAAGAAARRRAASCRDPAARSCDRRPSALTSASSGLPLARSISADTSSSSATSRSLPLAADSSTARSISCSASSSRLASASAERVVGVQPRQLGAASPPAGSRPRPRRRRRVLRAGCPRSSRRTRGWRAPAAPAESWPTSDGERDRLVAAAPSRRRTRRAGLWMAPRLTSAMRSVRQSPASAASSCADVRSRDGGVEPAEPIVEDAALVGQLGQVGVADVGLDGVEQREGRRGGRRRGRPRRRG